MHWRRKHSPGHALGRVRGVMEAALVFVIAVSLAACTDRPATEDEFATDTTGLAGDTTGMMAQGMQQDTVNVEFTASEIDMPQTLTAGEKVFEVENNGDTEHGFELERQETADRGMDGMDDEGMDDQGMDDPGMDDPLGGQGIAGQNEWSIDSIEAGETETVNANLQEGSYLVYCPIDDHRDQGEEITVTVESSRTTAQAY